MSTRGTAATVDQYLANRKARGFNAFILMNIVHPGNSYGWPGTNQNGDAPFSTTDFLDTPNDRYFDFIGLIIDKAAAQGFAVELFYTYAGYAGGDQGWWSVVGNSHNTQAICYAWGQYLGNRFKSKANVIWMAGGDYTMPAGETFTRMHKILEGIRSTGALQLAGSEWNNPDSLVTDQQGFTYGTDPTTSDLQIDSYYGAGPSSSGQTYDTAHRSWARSSPVLPGMMEEPMYTYDNYAPIDSSRAAERRYQHWSMTSGGLAGSVWGIKGVWGFDDLTKLSDVACDDQQRLFSFYRSLKWWLMLPDGTGAGFAGRNLVVSGAGSGNSRITAAVASDGSYLLAYVPSTGTTPTTFSVDLRSMSGSSRARFWNPTSSKYTDVTGGAYSLANTGAAQSFTTPGDNGTGANDWMLLLDVGTGGGTGAGGSSGTGGAASGGRPGAGGASASGASAGAPGTGNSAGAGPSARNDASTAAGAQSNDSSSCACRLSTNGRESEHAQAGAFAVLLGALGRRGRTRSARATMRKRSP